MAAFGVTFFIISLSLLDNVVRSLTGMRPDIYWCYSAECITSAELGAIILTELFTSLTEAKPAVLSATAER